MRSYNLRCCLCCTYPFDPPLFNLIFCLGKRRERIIHLAPNVLMTPCLRDYISLGDTVRDNVQKLWNMLDHRSLVTARVVHGILAWSSGIIF